MTIVQADALDFFRGIGPNMLDGSMDDPPSGMGFAGLDFDSDRGGRDRWIDWLAEIQRARLAAHKPGAYALTWAIPRTSHWTMTALENAGWRIRTVVTHLFGQGYPGRGRIALKPAAEFWILTQKPLEKGLTVQENVAKWGTGELNIQGARVPRDWTERGEAWMRSGHSAKPGARKVGGAPVGQGIPCDPAGGWPPSTWLTHCEGCEEALDGAGEPVSRCLAACPRCYVADLAPAGAGLDPPPCTICGGACIWSCPVAEVDAQSGERPSGARREGARKVGMGYGGARGDGGPAIVASTGGAARFFACFRYCAKAPAQERHLGCEDLLWAADEDAPLGWRRVDRATFDALLAEQRRRRAAGERIELCSAGNVHPTPKPLDFCRYGLTLLRPNAELVARPRGAEGFGGSCSITIAATLTGWDYTACDELADAVEIGRARLAYWKARGKLERPRGAKLAMPDDEPKSEPEQQLGLGFGGA